MNNFNNHCQLIDILNKIYNKGFKKFKDQKFSRDFEFLDINDINNAVLIFTEVLNLNGGSLGKYDLYKLMQEYLTNIEKRNAINKILEK
ncbi:hypothetical protein [Apibacter sp. ESL0404]|uniref:hypothetical protein n=1 Tax=Apibacter sp. ESL0404 TaxID=2704651 RepID=UPI001C69B8F9|nr:hypothetical protein [Apibacter sp. ESL0404]QYN51130.1 hypothetical protein GYM72_06100 [Apibacter sp. ESL0404]